jgi:hypothetical protein
MLPRIGAGKNKKKTENKTDTEGRAPTAKMTKTQSVAATAGGHSQPGQEEQRQVVRTTAHTSEGPFALLLPK